MDWVISRRILLIYMQEVFGSILSCDTDCPEWRCTWSFSVLEANYAITAAFHIPSNEIFSPNQLFDTA
jgi:hypothetical protein